MAEVKISELPNADLPLDGTEVVPIVQNGVSKQVAIDEVGSKRPSQIQPTVIHDGSPQTGIIVNERPWDPINEYYIDVQVPPINVAEEYRYVVSEFANFIFRYDSYGHNYPTQVTVNAPAIIQMQFSLYGSDFVFNTNAEFLTDTGQLQGVSSINAPNCVGAFGLSGYGSQGPLEFSFPNLKFVTNGISLGGSIGEFDVPLLEIVGNIYMGDVNFPPNSNLSLPSLKYCKYGMFISAQEIQTFDLSSLIYSGGDITLDNCYALTTLIMPSLLFLGDEHNQRVFMVNGTPLNQASVDNILERLDITGQYNGMVSLGSLCSAPSAFGNLMAQSLINKGWSVTTN